MSASRLEVSGGSGAPFEAAARDAVQRSQPQRLESTVVVPLGMATEQRLVHQELLVAGLAPVFLTLGWESSHALVLESTQWQH